MKKLLALTLSLLMTVLCLAACGEGSSSVPPFASSQAGESQAAEEQPAESQAGEEQPAESQAGEEQPAESQASQENGEEDHTHINYKGLSDAAFTIEDVVAAEGREADFSFESNGSTAYAYNDVVLDTIAFSQVQYFFTETGNRISCTYTADQELETVMNQWKDLMTGIYGEPAVSGNNQIWRDGHTQNQITLTMLNDTTIQLAFYFIAQ